MNFLFLKPGRVPRYLKLLASSILALLLIALNVKAQQTNAGNRIYTAVEHSAEFPGGMNVFYNFLAKNIKYPAVAREKNVQGKVFLTFVVEKNGSLSSFKVLREPGAGLGKEAIRVMKLSPKWKPGTQKGIAVRQQYTVPVNFSLKVK
jgi:protein TonB